MKRSRRGLWLWGCCCGLALAAPPALAGEVYTQLPTVEQVHVNAPADKPAEAEAKPQRDALLEGPNPQWIWDRSNSAKCYLRKTFTARGGKAELIATSDNRMNVFLNGKSVARSSTWQTPVRAAVELKKGENVLLVEAANEGEGGARGFLLKLAIPQAGGKRQYVLSDNTWRAAKRRDAKQWSAVKVLADYGAGPWGKVFEGGPAASPAQRMFNVPPGFQVELLYTVPKEKLGSWVAITFDEKGRLIASDQGDKGLARVTPPPIGSSEPTKVESLDVKMTGAQGLECAFGSLYVSANGGPGSGFYRLRDTNGDDHYDKVEKLIAFQGGGEHGPHSVEVSPDGKSLYVVCGNHTNHIPLEQLTASRVPTNWGEDLLLPRQPDARGHAAGRFAPGGWIVKTDPDGETWEMISSGYRNCFDFAFNADGEMFAYDADMEWDMGMPWYRPTRVVHATSGSEFGWRNGTGKWPAYYVDSLPPVLKIGPGSPVGVTFGTGAKFPAKYQKALFSCDWTFGTMYAVHLTPKGSSYIAEKEEFVSRAPLPLTDVEIGPDGALYFTIGGRGTQSALYRVTYVGEKSTAPADLHDERGAKARALRRKIESYHHRADNQQKAIDFVWPYLGYEDRFIRFAARIALEHQDAKLWQERALAEKDPQASITALVALARQGDKALEGQALAALDRIKLASLPEPQKLELLRAYQLVFIRMGEPDGTTAKRLAAKFDKFYPSQSDSMTRELCQLLVYLNSPTVISKSLELMRKPYEPPKLAEMDALLARNGGYAGAITQMLANQPDKEKVHLAFCLRNMKYGWTLDQRKEYFAWLDKAATRSGGASYRGFIANIRKDALANATEAERQAIASAAPAAPPKKEELPKPKGPGRDWTVAEVLALADQGLRGRSYENGRRTFAAAQCVSCHRFAGAGGATGPDLTNLAGRFTTKDLVEAIIEPSKVVSDQYQAHVVVTLDGKTYTGRILKKGPKKLTVLTDPVDISKTVELAREEIDVLTPSKVSLMPQDLLKPLNRDEVLDLLAYLLSRGNPRDAVFAGAARER